ncbi:hypothetical protein [Nocardia cyriacigeorgica]|nr:hypothetical protein [Nocardia cyriacigeorgica]
MRTEFGGIRHARLIQLPIDGSAQAAAQLPGAADAGRRLPAVW